MAAPKGNKYAAKPRIATHALEKALAIDSGEIPEDQEFVSKFQSLVDIWRAQINKAKEGDHQSAAMIVDRLEGKPAQAVNHGGQEDNPVLVCGWEK